MHRRIPSLLAALLLSLPAAAAAPPADSRIAAVVETTLTTAYTPPAGQLRNADPAQVPIRQFAFDGDPNTYFGSSQNLTAKDHFTLIFDKPVALKSIVVTTGKPDGSDKLDAGTLQVSADGKTFSELAKFADGAAKAQAKGQQIQAIRIKPAADLQHPLAIREIVIESDPQVAVFKYPVEIFVNVDDAPDMKEWIDKVARVCERQYYMLNEELKSDGFKPRSVITMTLKNDYNGVAATGGSRITGAVKFFKAHPDDIGAMVHETTHVVQAYGGRRGNPGWLVEGLCDWLRFFKYEPPGKLGRPNPDRWHYNGSYRVTAHFLNYLVENYDKEIIKKLNTMMREGKYTEDVWQNLTGKTAQELDEEWRATLKR
jgi:hypothetical protein